MHFREVLKVDYQLPSFHGLWQTYIYINSLVICRENFRSDEVILVLHIIVNIRTGNILKGLKLFH